MAIRAITVFFFLLILACSSPNWAVTGTITIKGNQYSEGNICADYWVLVIPRGGGLYGFRTTVPVISNHYVGPDSQFIYDWEATYNRRGPVLLDS